MQLAAGEDVGGENCPFGVAATAAVFGDRLGAVGLPRRRAFVSEIADQNVDQFVDERVSLVLADVG